MTGTIYTKNGNLYVKDFYSNKYVIKVTLTDDENEQMYFRGYHHGGNPESDNDVYSTPPNFKPLMAVRDILKRPEMSYIQYKRIEYTIDESNTKRIPSYSEKYKGLNGKKVSVTDLANGKEVVFMVGERVKEVRKTNVPEKEEETWEMKEKEVNARLAELLKNGNDIPVYTIFS